jgi:hypothetical protein
VEWPYPFSPIEHPEDKPAFEAELRRELKPGHPLFGLPVAAIGRRYDQDDVPGAGGGCDLPFPGSGGRTYRGVLRSTAACRHYR